MRKGYTVFELLVTLFIGFCFLFIFCGCIGGCIYTMSIQSERMTAKQDPFIAKVVRKYEFQINGNTEYRVDVQRENSTFIETLKNVNDVVRNKLNSVAIHANLLEGKSYIFHTRGVRDEQWGTLPNIEKIEETELE